jgi:glycosyltransferase involved in cell wall biosynthesis
MPRISIIIPFRNNWRELELCLSCLENQSFPRSQFEIIAVNNGEATGAAAAIAKFPAVRWLFERSPGSYAARNRGLQEATGEIIAFTDADCQPDVHWISNAASRLQADSHVILGGEIAMLGPMERELNVYELYESLCFGLCNHRHSVERKGFVTTANLIAPKDIFKAIGWFDGELRSGGDREWVDRAVLAGVILSYADDVIVCHPRRSTFREILRKTLRISGGKSFMLKRRNATLRYYIYDFFAQSIFRSKHHAFAVKAKGVSGWKNRVHFFFLVEALNLITMAMRLWVYLGGTPYRG